MGMGFIAAVEYFRAASSSLSAIDESEEISISLLCLAKIYLEGGHGVDKDITEACFFIYKLIDCGDLKRGYYLWGQIFSSGVSDGKNTIDKDLTRARKYFKLSANKENVDAMFELGRIVVKGLGEDEEELVGTKVKLHGLVGTNASWNGQTGVVLSGSYNEDSGRYGVAVYTQRNNASEESSVVKVLQRNLLKVKLTDVERLKVGLEYIEKAESLGNAQAKEYLK